ncbi:hypothetical protein Pelo_13823 [Pelomyxa schiedti]|nr:hypothetical protein Pelo_13823 [Pelomyxa schiedti]
MDQRTWSQVLEFCDVGTLLRLMHVNRALRAAVLSNPWTTLFRIANTLAQQTSSDTGSTATSTSASASASSSDSVGEGDEEGENGGSRACAELVGIWKSGGSVNVPGSDHFFSACLYCKWLESLRKPLAFTVPLHMASVLHDYMHTRNLPSSPGCCSRLRWFLFHTSFTGEERSQSKIDPSNIRMGWKHGVVATFLLPTDIPLIISCKTHWNGSSNPPRHRTTFKFGNPVVLKTTTEESLFIASDIFTEQPTDRPKLDKFAAVLSIDTNHFRMALDLLLQSTSRIARQNAYEKRKNGRRTDE